MSLIDILKGVATIYNTPRNNTLEHMQSGVDDEGNLPLYNRNAL